MSFSRFSRLGLALPAFFALWLAACGEQAAHKVAPAVQTRAEVAPAGRAMAGAPAQAPANIPADVAAAAPDSPPADGRFIAYTHRYAIEAERAKLRAVLDAHIARCKQLDCVMVSQTYNDESEQTPPSGALSARVARKDREAFVTALKSDDSRVLSQTTQAQDLTMQVVDVEARMANLTQLRDRLRKLLADPRSGIKEAIEVEKQLAQTQGELDSMQAQRRVLAQQTERELFDISYQARRGVVSHGLFEPVKSALLNFGRVFMESVAGLITFVAAVFVWLVLLGVLVAVARRWWRRRKAA